MRKRNNYIVTFILLGKRGYVCYGMIINRGKLNK